MQLFLDDLLHSSTRRVRWEWLCAYTHTVWSHGWKWGVVSCSHMCNSPETFHCTDSSAAALCFNAVRDSLSVCGAWKPAECDITDLCLFWARCFISLMSLSWRSVKRRPRLSVPPFYHCMHPVHCCYVTLPGAAPYRGGAPGVPWCFAVFLCVLVPVRCP